MSVMSVRRWGLQLEFGIAKYADFRQVEAFEFALRADAVSDHRIDQEIEPKRNDKDESEQR